MSHALGRLPSTPDRRDFRARPTAVYSGAFVDVTPGFPEAPYDQGSFGSCVYNAGAAALDFARVKCGLAPLARPSRMFAYYNGRVLIEGSPADQDTGSTVRDGVKAFAKWGAPVEAEWPYDDGHFAAPPGAQVYADAVHDSALVYGAVDQGDVDNMIASGYPVYFGFDVYASFDTDAVATTGIVPVPNTALEQCLGGHSVLIVSTPKSGAQIPGADPSLFYRKVRNSWGTGWGVGGYCWMPTTIIDGAQSSDFWQITVAGDPNAPVPPVPTPTPTPAPTPSPTPTPTPDGCLVAAVAPFLAVRHTGVNKKCASALVAWEKEKGYGVATTPASWREFLNNAIVSAAITVLAAGAVGSLTPLIPGLLAGNVPTKAALIAAVMMGAGAAGSILRSLLTRFVGDPNSGSFTR